jgi:hypothetical protein
MTKGSPTITIRLPEPLNGALRAESAKTGQSLTELVQAAVRASLPDPEPITLGGVTYRHMD